MLDDLPVDGARVETSCTWCSTTMVRGMSLLGRGAPAAEVLAGRYAAVQWVGDRRWTLPVTAFWQSHRDAAGVYSQLVTDWAAIEPGATAGSLRRSRAVRGGLAERARPAGQVVSVDTSRSGARAGRAALTDLPQVRFVTDSVRKALSALTGAAAENRSRHAGPRRARGRRPRGCRAGGGGGVPQVIPHRL